MWRSFSDSLKVLEAHGAHGNILTDECLELVKAFDIMIHVNFCLFCQCSVLHSFYYSLFCSFFLAVFHSFILSVFQFSLLCFFHCFSSWLFLSLLILSLNHQSIAPSFIHSFIHSHSLTFHPIFISIFYALFHSFISSLLF